jgi:AraC-like DNA-binding protein
MPIFMDRHIVPGIEAKHAAEAHREDLKVQDEFGCRCMTYWVDEEHGSAFCLIDAPDMEAVKKMHDRAHGLVPHDIVQVNSNVVEAFLGRISDPRYTDLVDSDLRIFNDPAFRIILVSQTIDTILLRHQLGLEKADKLLSLYAEIVRRQIKDHEGREVEQRGNASVASFVSVTQAIDCALAIKKDLHIAAEPLSLRMGLNAGMPVTKSKELFGDTVKMGQYLCDIGNTNDIMLASIIREIYKNKGKDSGMHEQLKWIDPKDENFLQLLMDTLAENWQNHQYSVDDFCKNLSMSKSKLYRKCTEVTDKSPNELLREHRLLNALKLLKTDRNIAQTTFDCGFTSPSYFTKCFQQRFGIQPLAYQKGF